MSFWSQRNNVAHITSGRKLVSTISLHGFFSPFPFEHSVSNLWAFPETTQQSQDNLEIRPQAGKGKQEDGFGLKCFP